MKRNFSILSKFEHDNNIFKVYKHDFMLLNDTWDQNFIENSNHLQMNMKKNKLKLEKN